MPRRTINIDKVAYSDRRDYPTGLLEEAARTILSELKRRATDDFLKQTVEEKREFFKALYANHSEALNRLNATRDSWMDRTHWRD